MKLLHLNEKCRHARAAGVEVGLELCSCLTFKSKRMNKTLPPFSFTMSLCVCVCVCVCVCARCAECDEYDARDQRPLLADEGQPSVMDPESLPVQRSDSHSTCHSAQSTLSIHLPVR